MEMASCFLCNKKVQCIKVLYKVPSGYILTCREKWIFTLYCQLDRMYGDYMQNITERFMQKFISFLFLRPMQMDVGQTDCFYILK